MKRRQWLRAAAIAIACAGPAARADDIAPDRPGFGEAASVVERGRVQLEMGLAWTRVGREASVFDAPEALLRVGLGASLEVRLQPPDWLRAGGAKGTRSGWSDTAVGVRWQVAAGRRELALRGTLLLPTGSSGCSVEKVEPEAAVSWAHELGGGWSTSGTVSARGFTSVATTVLSPSVSIQHVLGSRGSTFLEYGANVADGLPPLHQLDHGYTWLPNPDTQLTCRSGSGSRAPPPASS
jgi:hypothetical protein